MRTTAYTAVIRRSLGEQSSVLVSVRKHFWDPETGSQSREVATAETWDYGSTEARLVAAALQAASDAVIDLED